jgi:hypothetical protein
MSDKRKMPPWETEEHMQALDDLEQMRLILKTAKQAYAAAKAAETKTRPQVSIQTKIDYLLDYYRQENERKH